jgi:hypothetical protein
MSKFLSAVSLTFLASFASQSTAVQAQDKINCTSGSQAQDRIDCTSTQAADPPRIVYDCANGLLIEAESYAELQTLSALDQCDPRTLDLNDRAVLINLTRGYGPFEIRTPHAIASVRGTQFYVDAQTLQTAVFVVDGVVAVERADGSDQVELAAGEGVTVTVGEPVVVKVWPAEKVAALQVRFGR